MNKSYCFNGGVSAKLISVVLLASVGALSACTTLPAQSLVNEEQSNVVPSAVVSSAVISENQSSSEVIKVSAVGYGSAPTNETYSAAQKKLMARRASKLDAFRALAEELQGVKINGSTSVSAMVAQTDGFRVFVEAYLRGAKIVSVDAMPDGNYETTMELTLDRQFFDNFK